MIPSIPTLITDTKSPMNRHLLFGDHMLDIRLIDNLMGGMDWSFAPLRSESALSELVVDLYQKQLPFIANIYSPHLDFATTLEMDNSSGYMEFERIALPRNPSNGVGSVCYSEGTCTFPLTPLEKLANPKLNEEFEEMFSFALDFKMTADDVNDVMAFHAEINETEFQNFTEHEKWQYAACIWLKLNSTESTINEWYQDITRYDCIFDDSSNCGWNHYYTSYRDAVSEEN